MVAIKLIGKLSVKFQSEDKKRLLENFFSLSVLQGANYILPLITLPYLVRVLGPEKFGLIAFAQSFIQYFNILTDYGFNLSATREISIHREDKEKVLEIFSSVMIIKFGLIIISFLILLVLVFTIPKFKNDWPVYFLTFGVVLGNVLFPIWFFQGIEKMKYITILNIVAKGIFTICIFIFVRRMANYLYVPLINSMGFLVAGGLSLRIVSRDFGIKFILPSFEGIKYQLKEGWHIFISTVASTVYMNNNIFLLGLMTNNTYVGYYSAGEKIIRATTRMLQPVSTTLFPFLSREFSKNYKKGLALFFKFLKMIGIPGLLFSVSILLFSKNIVNVILGNQYSNSIVVVRMLSSIPFFGVIGNLFAYHLFINVKLKYMIPRILIAAFAVNLSLNLALIPCFQHIGASIALALTEIFVPLAFITIYLQNF